MRLEHFMKEMTHESSIHSQKLDDLNGMVMTVGECITSQRYRRNVTNNLATTYILNTSKTIFSVEDNITDIVTNVNHLHEQMEKNTHGIHSMMDFKEKCKLLMWLSIVLKSEYITKNSNISKIITFIISI